MKTTALAILFFLTSYTIGWAQWTYIPDNNFETYLEQIGAGNGILNDDYVSTASVSSIHGLNISNKNIYDLTGIEDFTSLITLRASQNPFTTADLSSNVNLVNVEMIFGNLSHLNVSGCTQLSILKIYRNPIASVDLTTCVNLTEFWARECYLTSIDVSQNPQLEILQAYRNYITSIDVSNNPYLKRLEVDDNNISGTLDLTNNPKIEQAFANRNHLQSVTLGNNPVLNWLAVNGNQLTTLDVSGQPSIEKLMCVQNNITSLDLTNNVQLTHLYCGFNGLQSVSLPASSNFMYYDGPQNDLTAIDVSMCPALQSLILRNNLLTSLDVSNNTSIYTLEVENNQLTELDIRNNTAMFVFTCFGNDLTCLQANNGNNPNFARFWAYDNPNLTCIQVDDPTAVYLAGTAWMVDPQSMFNVDCSAACNPCTLLADAGADVTVYPGVAVINSPCGGPQSNFGCTNLNATPQNGTAPFTFVWSTGETTQTITACPTVPTNYTVTITDANGCTATDDVFVNTCDITANNGNKVQVINAQGNVISINIHALGAHLCNGGTLATGNCGNANRSGENNGRIELNAYPNPSTSGAFTLNFSEYGTHEIVVTDIHGRIVINSTIEGTQTTLQLAEYGRQMYFLNYFDGTSNQVIKLLH